MPEFEQTRIPWKGWCRCPGTTALESSGATGTILWRIAGTRQAESKGSCEASKQRCLVLHVYVGKYRQSERRCPHSRQCCSCRQVLHRHPSRTVMEMVSNLTLKTGYSRRHISHAAASPGRQRYNDGILATCTRFGVSGGEFLHIPGCHPWIWHYPYSHGCIRAQLPWRFTGICS